MKIVAVMGSYRKNGAGAGYVKEIEQAVKRIPGVEFEYIWLGDCDLKLCRGCMVCYEKGEAACPLKDGYLDTMRKLNEADAAVFYSPTYTLLMSGLMKTFFDRSSYVFHRPYFKGRRALVLTAVEAYGDRTALKGLKMLASMMGFSVAGVAGIVNGRYKTQEAYRTRVERLLEKQAGQLVRLVSSGKPVRPRLTELIAFHAQKASFGGSNPTCANDKRFWREAGWADAKSRFYCMADISPVKSLLARAVVFTLHSTGLLTM